MKWFLAKYKTSSLRTCHGSQCVGSMRHINDELINDTHTHVQRRGLGEGGGGKRGSNLRRHCKISIGVKGELRKQDEEEGPTYTYSIF